MPCGRYVVSVVCALLKATMHPGVHPKVQPVLRPRHVLLQCEHSIWLHNSHPNRGKLFEPGCQAEAWRYRGCLAHP